MDRGEVFKRNLLKRLYPESESVDEENMKVLELVKTWPSVKTPRKQVQRKKIYTVEWPPLDYPLTMVTTETDSNSNEKSEINNDSEEISSEGEDTKRRRRRKGRRNIDDKCQLEKGHSTLLNRQPLTKNQKRKLKKKRRKERGRAESFCSSGKEFVYTENKNSNNPEPKSF